MKFKMIAAGALMSCSFIAATASAKITAEQAAALGGDALTPMGAEVKGNADGSIPAWSGAMRGVPEGLKYAGPGDIYPDPYAAEKPAFTITAANMATYADKLSEGQKAMLKKYDTNKINVYP
jgi:hypothetical protein